MHRIEAERVLRAVRAEPDHPEGPSPEALSFHGLNPDDPRIRQAAALLPRIAALPVGLQPGKDLVVARSDDLAEPDFIAHRLPVHRGEVFGILGTEAAGLCELGYATVRVRGDQTGAVVGELQRLGVVRRDPSPANTVQLGTRKDDFPDLIDG